MENSRANPTRPKTSRRRRRRVNRWVVALLTVAGTQIPVAHAEPRLPRTEVKKKDDESQLIRLALRYLRRFPHEREGLVPAQFEDLRYPIPTSYRVGENEVGETLLDPVRTILSNLGASLTANGDVDNLRRVYEIVYLQVPPQFLTGFPHPEELKRVPLKRMRELWRQLNLMITDRFPEIIVEKPPSIPRPLDFEPLDRCTNEAGYEDGGPDGELADKCFMGEYHPDGLMANFAFPLQNDLTCIKDQGRRGTCVAHAIAAAVEMQTRAQGGPRENLSEQHIYFKGEAEVSAPTDAFFDGLPTSAVLAYYAVSGQPIKYEADWNYNRSPSRGAQVLGPNLVPEYPNSCTPDYWGEQCTDYAFQAEAVFPMIGLGEPVAPSIGAGGPRFIDSNSLLPLDPVLTYETTLRTAIMLLSGDIPVLASFAVTDRFRAAQSDGYVRYASNDNVGGGHAVLLIGFVANTDLPPTITPATQEGYFIVKNSWGIGVADCGLYYIDFAYLRYHGNQLNVISSH